HASLCGRVLGTPQEAVTHVARVNVVPGDRVDRIVANRDRALAGTCARARNIERGHGTVLSAQEAVIDIACVDVLSRDRPWRVDVLGCGALEGACARARNVERGDSAVRSAHET